MVVAVLVAQVSVVQARIPQTTPGALGTRAHLVDHLEVDRSRVAAVEAVGRSRAAVAELVVHSPRAAAGLVNLPRPVALALAMITMPVLCRRRSR